MMTVTTLTLAAYTQTYHSSKRTMTVVFVFDALFTTTVQHYMSRKYINRRTISVTNYLDIIYFTMQQKDTFTRK